MKFLDHFYKTNQLRENGIFILVCLIVLSVLGFFIPENIERQSREQIYSVSGLYTKYEDEKELSTFLQSVKSNDGYLVMGTSESTSLEGGNYYDFLNADEDLDNTKFSVLAGAGRTCGKHIPWLLHQKDRLKDLQLIYFINPVYWRQDLSSPDLSYYQRYLNYRMTEILDLTEEERESYYFPITEYHEELSGFHKVVESLEYGIRSVRKNYFSNLYYLLYPSEYEEKFEVYNQADEDKWISHQIGSIHAPETFDLDYNILKSFEHKNWFKPIDENSDFRYRELLSFINLCKNYGVEATFILGPINERFIESYSPSSLPAYQNTVNQIRDMLDSTGANYIDATDISPVLGAFDDHQHHSSYGAYLIYSKLKAEIDE